MKAPKYEMYTAPSGEQILGKGFVETKPGKKLRAPLETCQESPGQQ